MKKLFLILLFPAGVAFGQKKAAVVPPPANATDSLSYAIGIQVAEFYKARGVDSINTAYLQKAFGDLFAGKATMNEGEASNFIQSKMQALMEAKARKIKAEGEAFLAENAKKPGVVTLPSGLHYEVLTKGDGPIPKATDRVTAHYEGKLLNGVEFDNSYKRGEPLELNVGGVIKGWQEALQLMPVGSKWRLYIPSELAYGDRGAGADIPPGATLIFTIELLNIAGS